MAVAVVCMMPPVSLRETKGFCTVRVHAHRCFDVLSASPRELRVAGGASHDDVLWLRQYASLVDKLASTYTRLAACTAAVALVQGGLFKGGGHGEDRAHALTAEPDAALTKRLLRVSRATPAAEGPPKMPIHSDAPRSSPLRRRRGSKRASRTCRSSWTARRPRRTRRPAVPWS
mmetsp:Transcript_18796/g.64701  ORF Transcript_18796/g.64701 Transcript_18796/m.64701 type:complete len:174 (+) Transcript_18796:1306-1827(+)